eukprot:4910589-Amphidinium_carterae.2
MSFKLLSVQPPLPAAARRLLHQLALRALAHADSSRCTRRATSLADGIDVARAAFPWPCGGHALCTRGAHAQSHKAKLCLRAGCNAEL